MNTEAGPSSLGLRRRNDEEEDGEGNGPVSKKRVVSSQHIRSLEGSIQWFRDLHTYRREQLKEKGRKVDELRGLLGVSWIPI